MCLLFAQSSFLDDVCICIVHLNLVIFGYVMVGIFFLVFLVVPQAPLSLCVFDRLG